MCSTHSSIHQALPTDMTHYSLCLIPSSLCCTKHEYVTTDTPQPPQYESTGHCFIHSKSTRNASAMVTLLGIYPESQEPSSPLKVSITNVILFHFFTQTEFCHSKSLLKEQLNAQKNQELLQQAAREMYVSIQIWNVNFNSEITTYKEDFYAIQTYKTITVLFTNIFTEFCTAILQKSRFVQHQNSLLFLSINYLSFPKRKR